MGSLSFFVLLFCQDTVISLFLLSSFQFTQAVWTVEGKTATLCPCFHLVCSYSSLKRIWRYLDHDGFHNFQAYSLGEILMEHFPKVLIIVLFVCMSVCLYVCMSVCCLCKIFQYLWGMPL